jgi:DNA-directed RNA polymerase specialized sigma24 family protein
MNDDTAFTELIRRVRGGDGKAAEELIRLYEPEIRRELHMRLRMRDPRLRQAFDSMDVLQSVFNSFFLRTAAGQFDIDASSDLRGLLIVMARNKLAAQVRFQQRDRRDVRRVEGELVDNLSGGGASPSRVVAARELLEELRRRLSSEERKLAELRAEGCTWPEVVAAIGGTAEGRRKQLTRALDRIMGELDPVD